MKIKRLIVLFAMIALVAFFALPSMLFADSTSTTTVDQDLEDDWLVTDDTRFDGDSFEVQEADPTGSPGDPNDGEVMDVYCLDQVPDETQGNAISIGDIYDEANEGTTTDDNHIEYLMGNANWETNNWSELGLSLTDSQEVEYSEDAIEILSSVATGGTEVEDQLAVWSYTDNFNENDDANAAAIEDAVSRIVEENRDDDSDFVNIDELNDIDITLESGSVTLDASGNDTTGKEIIVTMEDPLVIGITDEGKTVILYILGGSVNVSFSTSSLVTDISTTMNDVVDGTGDHDGTAISRYYYYYWGVAYNPNAMTAIIGGWVDIDEDGLLDTNNPDMNYVPNLDIVVENEADLNDIDPNNDTYSLTTSDVDNTTVEGGTMLIPMEWSSSQDEWVYNDDNQRLSVKAYNEPTATEQQSHEVVFYPYGVSFGKNFEGTPPSSAEFDIYVDDGTGNPTGYSLGHDSLRDDGSVDFTNLLPGNYVIVETFTPPGYSTMSNIFITIAQDGMVSGLPESAVENNLVKNGSITIFKTGLEGNDQAIFSLSGPGGPYSDITLSNNGRDGWSNLPYGSYTITESYPNGNVYTYTSDLSSGPIVIGSNNENPIIEVVNTKTPPTTPPTAPPAITVLGIQELPFTGMHPAIPISGISMILGGVAMFVASSLRRIFRKK